MISYFKGSITDLMKAPFVLLLILFPSFLSSQRCESLYWIWWGPVYPHFNIFNYKWIHLCAKYLNASQTFPCIQITWRYNQNILLDLPLRKSYSVDLRWASDSTFVAISQVMLLLLVLLCVFSKFTQRITYSGFLSIIYH